MTTKTCCSCNHEKLITDFGIVDKIYRLNECRLCWRKRDVDNINSNPGKFFQIMLNAAKTSSTQRSLKGRVTSGECNLTLEHLRDLHTQQQGKCYYSKIPYVLKIKSHFQCSLERLDPKKGYVQGNVALIILELNHASQWTPNKVKDLVKLLQTQHIKQLVDFSSVPVKFPVKHTKKPPITMIDDKPHLCCTYCNILQPKTNMYPNVNGCKKCVAQQTKERKIIPRFHLSTIFRHAKARHKKKLDGKKITDEFELTLDYLIDLFHVQDGLCYYSGIPLQFGSYLEKHWTCSLERKDPSKGYTKENVCFIAYEFNVSDRTTGVSSEEKKGWSKTKFEIFKNAIKELYP